MPYIESNKRNVVSPVTSGELNYCISKLIREYYENHGKCYGVYNEIVGALECAKMEFYRRIVVPYEEIKIKENGDVY